MTKLDYESLKRNFLEKTTTEDPFSSYFDGTGIYLTTEMEQKIQSSTDPIDAGKKRQWADFFIPISKGNLEKLFNSHQEELKEICDFILKTTNSTTQSLLIEPSEEMEALLLHLRNHPEESKGIDVNFCRGFAIKKRINNFKELIEAPKDRSRYEVRYYDPFIKFFNFVYSEALQLSIKALKAEVKELQEEKRAKGLVKVPMNIFNVMLTTKSATLEKLENKIQEIATAIEKTQDEKRLTRLKKQKEFALQMLEKARVNFPDDFYFSVYQHYAIFGGVKLLYQNKFKPTEFTASAVLEALGFSKINKSEISELRQAFTYLTTQRFPCYYIRSDDKDPDSFNYANADTPIFLIYEEGRVNFNVDLSDDEIAKKKLYLCLLNPALVDDLQHFFSMIDEKLFANLRNYKQVTEDDLYFIEYLVKERHFRKQTPTQTTLTQICKIMKKLAWLEETGDLNRDRKRQIKDKTENLLKFAQEQKLVKNYLISAEGNVTINYLKAEESLLLSEVEAKTELVH